MDVKEHFKIMDEIKIGLLLISSAMFLALILNHISSQDPWRTSTMPAYAITFAGEVSTI